VFFSSATGTPLLYKAGTQYPVAAWFKRRNGSIFLVPNTEYDTSDDYPTFVEAAQLLVTAVDNLTGEQAERQWVVSKQQNRIAARSHPCYVDLGRIDELRSLSVQRFDLTKLIRFCEELNKCYANNCFLAAAMLTRSIINHVPPIFGYQSFVEVANNYGSRSFKRSMQNLQNSLRNIADSHLHLPIRNKESLPTRVQVDFSSDIDVLLAEIVRVLR
jgi:hypothetical protein